VPLRHGSALGRERVARPDITRHHAYSQIRLEHLKLYFRHSLVSIRIGRLLFVLSVNVSPSLRYISMGPTRSRRPADSRNCRRSCSSLGEASLVPGISRGSPSRSDCTREGPKRTASRVATVTELQFVRLLRAGHYVLFTRAYTLVHLCETFRFTPSTYSYLTRPLHTIRLRFLIEQNF